MKRLIILTTIISIVFAGFVYANPAEQADNPQGGPPWMDEGQPPPQPPQKMEERGHRGRDRGEMEERGHRGKEHGEMWRKKNRKGKNMHGKKRAKMREKIEKMRKENPEEFERLMKLRKENPEAFRKEIHKRYKKQFKKDNPEAFKKMQEMQEIKKQVHTLNQEYIKCEDADKKKEVKQQMRDLIGRSFDITQEFREEKINNLEKKTKDLRKKLQQRGENKKEMVDLRLKGLIDGEETVKW